MLLAVLFAISMLIWGLNVMNCISEIGLEDECFELMIFGHPKVKPIIGIIEACDNSDEDCITEVGKQAVMSKVENSVKNYPQNTEKN